MAKNDNQIEELSPNIKVEEKQESNSAEKKDYANFSTQDFEKELNQLSTENDIKAIDKTLKLIKPHFYSIKETLKDNALNIFTEEGGEVSDFQYQYPEEIVKIDQKIIELTQKTKQYFKKLNALKEQNLITKNRILEKLRELVDGEETITSLNTLKEIQTEWKASDPIPRKSQNSLWANYNALITRFYDQRSIYFELKELDRKKNLEAKIELCEKAETLVKNNNLKEAVQTLHELHNEYKHIGPVPLEEQTSLWERFKAASDEIHERKNHFNEQYKKELKENASAKKLLIQEIEDFGDFSSEKIRDWNTKTHEILEIQKKWNAIGNLPKAEAKEINKSFWRPFKKFFQNKSEFFKKIEQERLNNLKEKQKLVAQVEALKDSEEWSETAEKLKSLQIDWKKIGPAPRSHSDVVYEQFKTACDYFFNRMRESNTPNKVDLEQNFKEKEHICEQIAKAASSEDLIQLAKLFYEIGFVPKNQIKEIREKFNHAIHNFFKNLPNITPEEKNRIQLDIEAQELKNSPNANRRIYQSTAQLKKKIHQLNKDITLYKNNLQFFASSKNAEKLKKEYLQKIENSEEMLHQYTEKLNALMQLSE